MLTGTQLVGSNPARGRVLNDYYATSPEATIKFLDSFIADEKLVAANLDILEPAVGGGHIADVLKEHFWNSTIDVADLVDRGYPGTKEQNFLLDNIEGTWDLVITNPPFKNVNEFIYKALEVSERYVVMFAKLQLLESKSRYILFNSTPFKSVYVHSSRVQVYPNGKEVNENGKPWASPMAFAWFVWDKKYDGIPTVHFIE